MPKRYILYLYLIFSFKKQMLQGASTELFNPIVLKLRTVSLNLYNFLIKLRK